MREVAVGESETTIEALLDLVEGGEEVMLTRNGRRVARLVAERPAHVVETAQDSVRRMEKLRASIKHPLIIEEIIAYRNEGRR